MTSRTHDPLPSAPVVAVVGATGRVGGVLLDVLQARGFPASELIPLAGSTSKGKSVRFRGRDWAVGDAHAASFERVDLVFFAATGELSRELAPRAVAEGARVIDKSATWRLDSEVPLVVPEINAERLFDGSGLIACPNCTTIGLVMALEPLRRAAGLRRVVVTTLQSASGAGRAGEEELAAQERAAALGEVLGEADTRVFGRPLARNVLPVCERLEADGASTEERKLVLETRKILALPELDLAVTCTRVPVAVGHSASVWVETERPLAPREAREALAAFPGVRIVDEATPLDVAGSDDVLVGRVRAALSGSDRVLQLWQVADNLRKGAATNAVQIAERLVSS